MKSLNVRNIAYVFIILGTVSQLWGYWSNKETTTVQSIMDFFQNFGIELLSIGISVLIIDQLVARRQEQEHKERLIREFGSEHNTVASSACIELRVHGRGKDGWLGDGSLSGKYLRRANLRRANLKFANLSNATMRRANLESTKLYSANFRGADLRGINLSNSLMGNSESDGANFSDADLYLADLHQADCLNANFYGAKLDKCNLCSARLAGASNLNYADLTGACYDEHTQWPNNFNPERVGAVLVSNGKCFHDTGPSTPFRLSRESI